MYWVSEFALLLSLLQQLIRHILHGNFIVCCLEYQIVWAAGHYDTCRYVCVCVCVLKGGQGGRKGEREEERERTVSRGRRGKGYLPGASVLFVVHETQHVYRHC